LHPSPDRVDGGRRWAVAHWTAAAGAAGAILLLAAASTRPAAESVAVALGALSAGLVAELVRTSRATLQRERRLVDQSASLRLLAARLEDIARQDAVTGIFNRRALMDDLAAEVYRAARYGRPLSVLLLDIDHFKAVNDSYGHQFGDAVLAATATTLKRTVRASDTVARYGGEEFVVILPETALDAAAITAEKVRAAVESTPAVAGGQSTAVTVSIGVAMLEPALLPALEAAQTLLARADAAMYEAKRGGRNRVRRETDLTQEERRAA
jgi:diguanylate cyclase (GGDEF)-like protein